MNELASIQNWLHTQRGRWSAISRETGLNLRTIQRIAHGDVKTVNLDTYGKLSAVRAKVAEASTPAPAPAASAEERVA